MPQFLLLLVLFFLSACTKQYYAFQYSSTHSKISNTTTVDSSMWLRILPYKDSLDAEMNTVIGTVAQTMQKQQPESALGNWMCDAILSQSRQVYSGSIDFTVLNHGGIRLPSLAQGEVTIGRIYELMPFDNRLVVMMLDSSVIQKLFDLMAAKGGWHVAGARYTIKEGRAKDIYIHGNALQNNRTYAAVLSDYLANGGDNCAMLQGVTSTDIQLLLRDALIQAVKAADAEGQPIVGKLENRVSLHK